MNPEKKKQQANKNGKLAKEWLGIGDKEFTFAKAAFEKLGSFYPQICFQC